MNHYVLELTEDGTFRPKIYFGNIFLIGEKSNHYRHTLKDKGRGRFELFNVNPNNTNTNCTIRCPKCSSKLVRVTANNYQCVICKGK
ncbi:MAG: hypothetical protein GX366_09175 [Epulopiscium sp.]|nr:hypothetical protein [Candidatus Epulonipiscium sp.]